MCALVRAAMRTQPPARCHAHGIARPLQCALPCAPFCALPCALYCVLPCARTPAHGCDMSAMRARCMRNAVASDACSSRKNACMRIILMRECLFARCARAWCMRACAYVRVWNCWGSEGERGLTGVAQNLRRKTCGARANACGT
eukprot:6204531-Pleurochrysis_carterae.AAC.1